MKKINWTSQQQRAIKHRGTDVLVTASAGTGKTAVLSGRCVDIVADKQNCTDVWSILVLTFTDAAAEQMRARIAARLREQYTATKDRHIKEQLVLLQGADIGTIHSFCRRLITEHFYKLNIDPTFGILDADEQRLLKAEILQQTIDWAWQQNNLTAGLKELLNGRNISGSGDFLNTVVQISDFLETVVWRDNWYERATKTAQADEPPAEKQKQLIAKQLDEATNTIIGCCKAYQKLTGENNWSQNIAQSHIVPLAKLQEILRQNDWDEFAAAFTEYEKPKKTSGPKEPDDKTVKDLLRLTVKQAIDDVEQFRALAILNPEYMEKIGSSAGRQVLILIELVKKFEQLYSRAKQKLNRMDFADLERYALRLLAEKADDSEQLIPSKTAKTLQSRYKYIFVDEYQDINPVQKAILDSLANKGSVFVVGDVKQSIYAFRGARPGIFVKELQAAASRTRESADSPRLTDSLRVDLNNNFRSAKGILDFVNTIFRKIMRQQLADIDYDESAMLKTGLERQPAEPKRPAVELHLLNEKPEEEPDQQDDINTTTARQRQAAMLAQRIRQIVGADTGKAEFEIFDSDTGCNRPVEYRDIVILVRSAAKKVNDYVELLQLAGIPVSCEAAAGYFEATEIRDCLCLLKVLDNPQRDIELAALLRGPLFNITDTELARIRLIGRADESCKNFYDCLAGYSQTGPDNKLADKLKNVLAEIETWRQVAGRESLSDLIWRIYSEKKLPAYYSALPNGKNRRANLLKLHERAIQFEGFAGNSGGVSLSRFVSFVERLQDAGAEWSTAEPEDAAANAVRIMSVHKSKGLEFPVVFLAELQTRFNMTDMRQPVLVDTEAGLGIEIIEQKNNARLSNATHQIIAQSKRAENIAEEMRILYVAMTRAKDRLILSACVNRKSCAAILTKATLLTDEIISRQLADCNCAVDWILFGLAASAKLHKAFETTVPPNAENEDLFELSLYDSANLKQLSEYIHQIRTKKSPQNPAGRKTADSALLQTIKKSLSWQYKHAAAVALPSKQSVTSLTHRDDEFAVIDYSNSLERLPAVLTVGGKPTAQGRIVGTATHAVIARLDLKEPVTSHTVKETIENLIAQSAIDPQAANSINVDAVVSFFDSPPGSLALDEANTVQREWPFTYAMAAADGEKIVVQGIIDMLIKTPAGLLIIDFKTDRIGPDAIDERAEIYRRQLALYAEAAEAILKTKTLTRWLYFLNPRRAVSL